MSTDLLGWTIKPRKMNVMRSEAITFVTHHHCLSLANMNIQGKGKRGVLVFKAQNKLA